MYCNGAQTSGDPNATQFWAGVAEMIDFVSCGNSSYLRPDAGGSPIPYHFVALLLLVRAPLVFIRVARWDKGQTLSILLAIVGAFITTLAFSSTSLAPDKITVWTPIILVGDAGAMLQVFILLVEKSGSHLPIFRHLIKPAVDETSRSIVNPRLSFLPTTRPEPGLELNRIEPNGGAPSLSVPIGTSHNAGTRLAHGPERNSNGTDEEDSAPSHASKAECNSCCQSEESPRVDCFFICTALLILFWILGLQIASIIYAKRGLSAPPSTIGWCSPVFLYQTVVQTSECIVYSIQGDAQKGIGCIMLPAKLQKQWLYATIVFVPISLALEFIDLIILVGVNSKYRIFGATKLKRPWFTMIAGIAALIVVGVFAIMEATSIPSGITPSVLLAADAGGGGAYTICQGRLHAAALRGETLAWMDSLFNSWACVWYGCD